MKILLMLQYKRYYYEPRKESLQPKVSQDNCIYETLWVIEVLKNLDRGRGLIRRRVQ